MTNKTIRRHELHEDKFIFPRGRWECYICLQPKIWMEVVEFSDECAELSETTVVLICIPCRRYCDEQFARAAAIEN